MQVACSHPPALGFAFTIMVHSTIAGRNSPSLIKQSAVLSRQRCPSDSAEGSCWRRVASCVRQVGALCFRFMRLAPGQFASP